MLEQTPASGRVAPLFPTNPLTKHVSCLMCPIELQCLACCRDFRDDISKWAEAPGGLLAVGEARVVQVGGTHPTEPSCVCRPGWKWH